MGRISSKNFVSQVSARIIANNLSGIIFPYQLFKFNGDLMIEYLRILWNGRSGQMEWDQTPIMYQRLQLCAHYISMKKIWTGHLSVARDYTLVLFHLYLFRLVNQKYIHFMFFNKPLLTLNVWYIYRSTQEKKNLSPNVERYKMNISFNNRKLLVT